MYQLKLKDAISCSEFWRVKIHSARLWIIVVDLPCPLQTSILFILLRIAYFICLTIYLFYVVTSNNLYHVKYLFCGIIFYLFLQLLMYFCYSGKSEMCMMWYFLYVPEKLNIYLIPPFIINVFMLQSGLGSRLYLAT